MLGMDERIEINPEVCGGRPIVRGTRVTVQTVLEHLGAGDSIDDLVAELPVLTREDVLACLRYSSRMLGHQFTVGRVA